MNKDIDVLLNQVLTPDYEPSEILNRKVLNQAKETKKMKQSKIKVASAVVVALATVSITATAATHFLNARDVAKSFDQNYLAEAFEKAGLKEAEEIVEQQDYRFAYLGTVSGKNIVDLLDGEEVDETYMVIAAERLDGSSATENEEGGKFVASPFIQGLAPFEYNIYSMAGGATWKIIDGVYYMIVSCKNIEMFADRQIYLGITEGPDYRQAFDYDEASGLIERNSSFDGINALFKIKLDESKADEKAQQDYLDNFGKAENTELEEYTGDSGRAPMLENGNMFGDNQYINFLFNIDYSKLEEKDKAYIISQSTVLYEDVIEEKDGLFIYSYETDYSAENGYSSADLFEEGKENLQAGSYDQDNYVTFEYTCMENHKLNLKIYGCDEKKVKEIYNYFH